VESDAAVLVTGASGFTGRHVLTALLARGLRPIQLQGRLDDVEGIVQQLRKSGARRVLHLAGMAVTHNVPPLAAYDANVIGTASLLTALSLFRDQFDLVVLASTATTYLPLVGQVMVDETTPVCATNHYGASKLAMETVAEQFRQVLPIVIVRPFNYTGIGQNINFLIPKIVAAFQRCQRELVMGNQHVTREFNDVRYVAQVYADLLMTARPNNGTVNLCTGRGVSISEVLHVCTELSGHEIHVRTDPVFVRPGEPSELVGNPSKLESLVSTRNKYSIRDTLVWMLSVMPTTSEKR
jgi:nucleoside-diphosphate-sugar epimerase